MVLVDSSVWIYSFKNRDSIVANRLKKLLSDSFVLTCDLVMMEVLRGFHNEQQFRSAKRLYESLEQVSVADSKRWLQSVDWYRHIRKQGFTIRSQVDILLAMYCHETGIHLLHMDKDFTSIASVFDFNQMNALL